MSPQPGPVARVDAPVALPPELGLINSAERPTDNSTRWELGFAFNPERCGIGGVGDFCGFTNEIDPNDNRGIITTRPFPVWAGDTCSALDADYVINDLPARVRRALAAIESREIAHEFWDGAEAIAQGWGNQYLTAPGATVLTTAAGEDPVDALTCLEQAKTQCAPMRGAMIHCTPQVATLWIAARLVDYEAGQLRTKLRTIVIPDAGYSGHAPVGVADSSGVSWAFVTGRVQLRQTPPRMVPDTGTEGWITQATNRETNRVEIRATSLAAVDHDGCCRVAAGVQVPVCLNTRFGS